MAPQRPLPDHLDVQVRDQPKPGGIRRQHSTAQPEPKSQARAIAERQSRFRGERAKSPALDSEVRIERNDIERQSRDGVQHPVGSLARVGELRQNLGEAQRAEDGVFRKGAFDDIGTGSSRRYASNAEASRTVTSPGPLERGRCRLGGPCRDMYHVGSRRAGHITWARGGLNPWGSMMRFRGKESA